jgi:hypothetical protein
MAEKREAVFLQEEKENENMEKVVLDMKIKKSPKAAKNADASLLVRLCPTRFGDSQQK